MLEFLNLEHYYHFTLDPIPANLLNAKLCLILFKGYAPIFLIFAEKLEIKTNNEVHQRHWFIHPNDNSPLWLHIQFKIISIQKKISNVKNLEITNDDC